MQKPTTPEDYKLLNTFEGLRKLFTDDRFADRLERQLGYFVLPTDRRLPLAFLERTLADLLGTPFQELACTAGIGQKKIGTMLKLLHRATRASPPACTDGTLGGDAKTRLPLPVASARKEFDPSVVSEAVWEQWCGMICQNGLGTEKLGRVAISLRSLATNIWHTPLSNYCNSTLAEIRGRKTHGQKRVRSILEIFFWLHDTMQQLALPAHLTVRLAPGFIRPIEQWLADATSNGSAPSAEDVRRHVVTPLVKQVRVDVGPQIAQLAETRLGTNGPPQRVRIQSKKIGVTRARVYQMLEECNRMMVVRWPEGAKQLGRLQSTCRNGSGPAVHELVERTVELFFPGPEQLARRSAKVETA